jgi:beta-lactamase superfamily II metal-dependent hydrolase
MVDHIRANYGTKRVDLVVNSHPDGDHASGLSVVLDKLDVGAVYMHRPWEHSAIVREYFHDGRITDKSLAEHMQEKMAAAYALEQAALQKGLTPIEPFQGQQIGDFWVMSPHRDWYIHDLIPQFTKTPKPKQTAAADSMGGLLNDVGRTLQEVAGKIATWVDDHWDIETLAEDGETSAENESSVVLYGYFEGRGFLLTGDAGNQALGRTADFAEASGMKLPALLRFLQMPHHGSRRNVSPSVLNRILGPKLPRGTEPTRSAFVSCSSECSTHPRKVVTNAFRRRGFRTARHESQGQVWIRHNHNMAARPGTVPLNYIPWANKVES